MSTSFVAYKVSSPNGVQSIATNILFHFTTPRSLKCSRLSQRRLAAIVNKATIRLKEHQNDK